MQLPAHSLFIIRASTFLLSHILRNLCIVFLFRTVRFGCRYSHVNVHVYCMLRAYTVCTVLLLNCTYACSSIYIYIYNVLVHVHVESHEALNMYFCFRWLLVHFKREFVLADVMRIWEVRY